MNVTPIKTNIIHPGELTVEKLLDRYITSLQTNTVVILSSKIVAVCENRILKKLDNTPSKQTLAEQEADFSLPPSSSKYEVTLTIKNHLLLPSAGIDESNGNGNYIFLPLNPQLSANNAREFLTKKFSIPHIGVIISDSRTTPLRWGVTGASIAQSGFAPVNDFIGKPDIFGRILTMTKINVADALAAAAVLVMGEANEQTPIATITDIPFVQFQDRNPTQKEIDDMYIDISDDIYEPILSSVTWRKNKLKP